MFSMENMKQGAISLADELETKMNELVSGYNYLQTISKELPQGINEIALYNKENMMNTVQILTKEEKQELIDQTKQIDYLRDQLNDISSLRIINQVKSRDIINNKIKDLKDKQLSNNINKNTKDQIDLDSLLPIPIYQPSYLNNNEIITEADRLNKNILNTKYIAKHVGNSVMIPSVRQGSLPPELENITTSPDNNINNQNKRSKPSKLLRSKLLNTEQEIEKLKVQLQDSSNKLLDEQNKSNKDVKIMLKKLYREFQSHDNTVAQVLTKAANDNINIVNKLNNYPDNKVTINSTNYKYIKPTTKTDIATNNTSDITTIPPFTYKIMTVGGRSESTYLPIISDSKADNEVDNNVNKKLDKNIYSYSIIEVDKQINKLVDGNFNNPIDKPINNSIEIKNIAIQTEQMDEFVVQEDVDSNDLANEIIGELVSTIDSKIDSKLDSKLSNRNFIENELVSILSNVINQQNSYNVDSQMILSKMVDMFTIYQTNNDIDSKIDSQLDNKLDNQLVKLNNFIDNKLDITVNQLVSQLTSLISNINSKNDQPSQITVQQQPLNSIIVDELVSKIVNGIISDNRLDDKIDSILDKKLTNKLDSKPETKDMDIQVSTSLETPIVTTNQSDIKEYINQGIILSIRDILDIVCPDNETYTNPDKNLQDIATYIRRIDLLEKQSKLNKNLSNIINSNELNILKITNNKTIDNDIINHQLASKKNIERLDRYKDNFSDSSIDSYKDLSINLFKDNAKALVNNYKNKVYIYENNDNDEVDSLIDEVWIDDNINRKSDTRIDNEIDRKDVVIIDKAIVKQPKVKVDEEKLLFIPPLVSRLLSYETTSRFVNIDEESLFGNNSDIYEYEQKEINNEIILNEDNFSISSNQSLDITYLNKSTSNQSSVSNANSNSVTNQSFSQSEDNSSMSSFVDSVTSSSFINSESTNNASINSNDSISVSSKSSISIKDRYRRRTKLNNSITSKLNESIDIRTTSNEETTNNTAIKYPIRFWKPNRK